METSTFQPRSRSGLLVCCLAYLILSLPNLDVPGLHLDEGMYGLVSSFILKPAEFGQLVPVHYFLTWFGRILPVMAEHYVGPVAHYYLAPFIWIFGHSALALRLACVLVGLGTLWAVFGVLETLFGRRAAFFSTLLLAVDIPFIHVGRVACHREEMFAIFFLWVSLLFLTRFKTSNLLRYLALSGFFFGLGLSLKIIFLWYLAALAVVLTVFYGWGGGGRGLRWVKPKFIGVVFFSFIAGASPLIVFNFFHPLEKFRTLRLGLHSLVSAPAEPETLDYLKYVNSATLPTRRFIEMTKINDNLDYPENVVLRARQLLDLTRGKLSFFSDWGVGSSRLGRLGGKFLSGITLFSILCLNLFPLFSGRRFREINKRILVFNCFYVLVFFLTPLTVRGFNAEHVMIVWPYPLVTVGLVLAALTHMRGRMFRIGGVLSVVLLVSWTTVSFVMGVDYNLQARRNGGRGRWTAAVVDLADYLQVNQVKSPIMFGLLAGETIRFLTDQDVVPLLCVTGNPAELKVLDDILTRSGQGVYYVWAGTEFESAAARERFLERARKKEKNEVLEKVFHNRAGEPVYWLHRVVPAPEGKSALLTNHKRDSR